jgi:hypothetical protein
MTVRTEPRDDAACIPALPAGYHAQPAWQFHDATGRVSYELNRVYGPTSERDQCGPICHLDEDLSYWGVTWPTLVGTPDERPAGRWMTYAQARKLRGSAMTFERFSSLPMRDELAQLLNLGDVPQKIVSPAREPAPPPQLVPVPRPAI